MNNPTEQQWPHVVMMKKRPGSQKEPTDTMPSHNSTKRKTQQQQNTHLYPKRKMRQKNPRLFLLFTTFPSLCLFTCYYYSFSVLEAMVATKYFVAGYIYKESWIWFYFLKKVPPLLTLKYL